MEWDIMLDAWELGDYKLRELQEEALGSKSLGRLLRRWLEWESEAMLDARI